MLVNLTTNKNSLPGYKTFAEVLSFSREVQDNEATSIVCENFLCGFSFDDLPKILNLIVSKMRLKCKLVISEKDFNLISRYIFREVNDINVINQLVFQDSDLKIRSILTAELIESLLEGYNLKLISKGFEDLNFSITLERV
tara:strand:- start:217 stop:639 length:423 start_codon:yes stop_codon:yes gene_type:complete